MAWLPGWKVKIGIPLNTSVTGANIGSDLSDRTLAINIDSSLDDFWDNVASDGDDIRVTDSDAVTLLCAELESFDYDNKSAWIHIKKPFLQGDGENNYIYIYVGNNDAVAYWDKENVYVSTYKGVYHNNQNKAEGAFDDSTSNDNDGTNSGSSDAEGQIDRGRSFDGDNDYIDCGNDASFNVTDKLTLSAWIKAAEAQWNNRKEAIISKWGHASVADFGNTNYWDFYNAENEDGANGMKGFIGAVFDGRYVYFVPYNNGARFGKVLRYDTTLAFGNTASWDVYNAENEDGANGMKGFYGAVFDGRYVYFVPYYNGARFGKVLRYDTTLAFGDTASWDVYNAENEDGANGMKGFIGAVFDGRYVYFVPFNNGAPFGKVLRYDSTSNGKASFSLDYTTNANSFGDTPHTVTFKLCVDGALRTVAYVGQNDDLQDAQHLITGVYDGTNMKIYIDGELKNTITYSASANILTSTAKLIIGADDGGKEYHETIADEVLIINDDLSADEVKLPYENTKDGQTFYSFDNAIIASCRLISTGFNSNIMIQGGLL